MRTVLYAHDMEPITILELSGWKYDFLVKHGEIRLAVIPPVKITPVPWEVPLEEEYRAWQVRITAEQFYRNGIKHLMLFTHDEESALLLKAAFLPGQQWTLRDIEREAFAKGFMQAFDAFTG